MRMTASWCRSGRIDRTQVCGAIAHANGELPSDCHSEMYRAPQTPERLREKPAWLSIVPPRAQASRRCETQAVLGGKAAKLR